jgi:tetratricopeptide (TPR) repeat protein
MEDPNDAIYFPWLEGLLSTSNGHALLENQIGLDEAKTEATKAIEDNLIFERTDSSALSLQLIYAQILYNQGSRDDAARIRQDVSVRRRQNKEPEYHWRLVDALRSYADSLTVSGDTSESRALLKEALDICKPSLKPENMSCAGRPTDEHLDASSSSGANCLLATENGGRVVKGTQSTLAGRSHDRKHKSFRRLLWKMMNAPARYLRSQILHMKSEPHD